jgi:hypothetical protein
LRMDITTAQELNPATRITIMVIPRSAKGLSKTERLACCGMTGLGLLGDRWLY